MLQSSGDKLQQIEVLLKAGDKPEALRLLVDYLRLNPTSPRAWWLMSQAVTDPGQKAYCLERLLQLDPGNIPAREQLQKLKPAAARPSGSPSSSPAAGKPAESPPPPAWAVASKPAARQTSAPPRPVSFTPPAPGKARPSRPAGKPAKKRLWILDVMMGVFVVSALSLAGFYFWQTEKTRATVAQANIHQQTHAVQTLLAQVSTPTPTITPLPTSTATATPLPTSTGTPGETPTRAPTPTVEVRPAVFYAAPDFSLTDVTSGEKVSLSQFAGQPVLVVFWTTWCPHCQEESESLQNLQTNMGDQGLVILAINGMEYPSAVNSFRAKYDLTYRMLLDPSGSALKTYKVTGYPMNFFIKPNGVIAYIQAGSMAYGVMAIHIKAMLQ
jgi:peroxiredoxin